MGKVYSPRRRNGKDMRVGLIYDEKMCSHFTPDGEAHPENPNRIKAIWKKLKSAGIIQRCMVYNAKRAKEKHMFPTHTKKHINFIRDISSSKSASQRKKSASRFNSIYFNEGSSEAAYLAAGSVIEVAKRVAKGELNSAFAIVRPPGHHAEKNEPMGFCLFNNVAIAASFLLNERPDLGIKKILVVDWDVHHGNGTQKMFWKDPRVLVFSVHRHDFGKFYPEKDDGCFTMIGEGAGKGYNINVPWEDGGCGDADYLAVWEHILIPVAKDFNPDLTIISAGFDAGVDDPLGGCCVSPCGYSIMLNKLMGFANGKIVMALEGGYNLDSLANSVLACVEGLLENKPMLLKINAYPLESTWNIIKRVRKHLSTFWPILMDEFPKKIANWKATTIICTVGETAGTPQDDLVQYSSSSQQFSISEDKIRSNTQPEKTIKKIVRKRSSSRLTKETSDKEETLIYKTTYIRQLRANLKRLYGVFYGNGVTLSIRDDHIPFLKKLPFWNLISTFYTFTADTNIFNTKFAKHDENIKEILRTYNKELDKFLIGDKQLDISSNDIKLIFGIDERATKELKEVPKISCQFKEKWFSNEAFLHSAKIRPKMMTASIGQTDSDRADFARLFCLYLLSTIFLARNSNRIDWNYLHYLDDLEKIKDYNWCQHIVDTLKIGIKETKDIAITNGCIIALPFWLCEHTTITTPSTEEKEQFPRLMKWSLSDLKSKMQSNGLQKLSSSQITEGEIIFNDVEKIKLAQEENQLPKIIYTVRETVGTPQDDFVQYSSSTQQFPLSEGIKVVPETIEEELITPANIIEKVDNGRSIGERDDDSFDYRIDLQIPLNSQSQEEGGPMMKKLDLMHKDIISLKDKMETNEAAISLSQDDTNFQNQINEMNRQYILLEAKWVNEKNEVKVKTIECDQYKVHLEEMRKEINDLKIKAKRCDDLEAILQKFLDMREKINKDNASTVHKMKQEIEVLRIENKKMKEDLHIEKASNKQLRKSLDEEKEKDERVFDELAICKTHEITQHHIHHNEDEQDLEDEESIKKKRKYVQ